MTNIELLRNQFPNKTVVGKKELAVILNISEPTINRALAANELDKLPKFKRFGKGPKARYIFTILAIAEFLES